MTRSEQPVSLWHGEPTLEPREYHRDFPRGFLTYTIKQGDHYDFISFKAYARHDWYYLILDANIVNGIELDVMEEPPLGKRIFIPIL